MKYYVHGILILLLIAFIPGTLLAKKELSKKELKEVVFQKTGLAFDKAEEISKHTYESVLKGVYESSEVFNVSDAIVTVGERFKLNISLYIGDAGPEYSNDNFMAPGFNIEVDGTMTPAAVINYLVNLPVDDELEKFIKSSFVDNDDFLRKYGLDYCLTSLMAGMIKYPNQEKFIKASLEVLKKYPDPRVLPFIENFQTEFNPSAGVYDELADLRKVIVEKKLFPQIFGRPIECTTLVKFAENIASGSDKAIVTKSISELSRFDCKESISYLFFLRNLSYLNRGENLFNNDEYFAWDTENLRFAIDLRTKETYDSQINTSYNDFLSEKGLRLTEALNLLAQRHKVTVIGLDSVYFRYLFRIPFNPEWHLTKKELKNLIENSLFASAGYYLKKSNNTYKIVKAY